MFVRDNLHALRGHDGDDGERGRDGRDGANGVDGRDGLSIKGDKGDRGPRGLALRGERGKPGKMGRRGVAGPRPDHEIEALEDGRGFRIRFQKADGTMPDDWATIDATEWLKANAENVDVPGVPTGVQDLEIQGRRIRFKLPNGDWTKWLSMGGGGGGGIPDAPKDGKCYCRQDGAWVEVNAGGAWQREVFVLTVTDIANGYVTLAGTPVTPTDRVFANGQLQDNGGDYTLTTTPDRVNFVRRFGVNWRLTVLYQIA
jgi:hypothetical protein